MGLWAPVLRCLAICLPTLLVACRGPGDPPRCPVPEVEVAGDRLEVRAGDCGEAVLQARAVGAGQLQVVLGLDGDAVVPTVSGEGVLEAVVLSGEVRVDGAEPARLWRQGYQSWSWSGVVDLEPMELDDDGLPVVDGDGTPWSVAKETAWTSWWVGLLGRPDGASLLLGALDSRVTKLWMGWGSDEVVVVWGGRGERIVVGGGEGLALDPLHVALGDDPWALYRGYGAAVAERVGARIGPGLPPTGWASWYAYYEQVDEELIRANLDRAVALRERADLAPLEVIQVDDGWAVAWGEWTANERFPGGMAQLAADIRAAGFVPGLWLAPFYVDLDSAVYADHPDWWVRDDDGLPLTFTNPGMGTHAVLDATHPQAGALRTRFAPA